MHALCSCTQCKRSHAQATLVSKATGCKNTYALMRLPNHDRTSQMVPDAMHTVTDSVEKLLYLIISKIITIAIFLCIKDTLGKTNEKMKGKVTNAEVQLRRFGLKPNSQVSVPWELSTSELKLANDRLSHISVPVHLDFKPHHVFLHPSRLKSHDWKQV